jgi:primary-amine oxidase
MAPHEVPVSDSVVDFVSNGIKKMTASSVPHPLEQLSLAESDVACKIIKAVRGSDVMIRFRSIFLDEPAKELLVPYLKAEHDGQLNSSTPRPPRLAQVHYDVVGTDKKFVYTESKVDLATEKETEHRLIGAPHLSNLTLYVYSLQLYDSETRLIIQT